jgi:hypothetical protein
MPALVLQGQKNLDSGLRRNDERRRRLPVDKFNLLGLRPRAIRFSEQQHNTPPRQNLSARIESSKM